MKWTRFLTTLVLLGVGVFVTPVLPRQVTELRMVDEVGRESLCPPAFARLHKPERDRLAWNALCQDLSYAIAEAGIEGALTLLAAACFVSLVLGMFCSGLRCGLRRVLVCGAVGVPLLIGLAYASCFMPGRTIHLGPEGQNHVLASLHTQTHHSTGFLSPRDLWRWHYSRGFRVLNVTDKDDLAGAMEAIAYGQSEAATPPLLVLAGEEWHGRPDVVLVNVKRRHDPTRPLAEVLADVEREGGGAFVAHPWSKMTRPLEEVLGDGLLGAELVNGVIHGGPFVLETAVRMERALLGVSDYKFGPHVTALTLLPAAAARDGSSVVAAIRARRTRILYAVPGGTVSSASYGAGILETAGAWAGVRTLLEVPRPRRLVWFVTLFLVALIWRVGSRRAPGKRLGVRTARILLLVSATLMMSTVAGLSWQVRESTGPLPIVWLLGASAVLAVPLLASTVRLAHAEEEDEIEGETNAAAA